MNPQIKELLGTMPDAEIARQFNLSRERIRQYRSLLRIKKFKDNLWTEEALSLLGEDYDINIAEILDVSTYKVCKKRQELGIPPYLKIRWTDEMIEALSTMSDPQVAKMFNISKSSVYNKRRDLNIKANPGQHTRWEPCIDWTPERDALIGTDSDAKIGEQLGIPFYAVRSRRIKLGIPSHMGSLWSEENLALLNKMPAKELADKLGVSTAYIYKKRRELTKLGLTEQV